MSERLSCLEDLQNALDTPIPEIGVASGLSLAVKIIRDHIEQAERAHQADRATIDILLEQGEDLARQRDVAERALADAKSYIEDFKRSIARVSDENINLRATLARAESVLENEKAMGRALAASIAAERDELRAALDQLKNEQHAGWHDLSKPMSECQQYPCTVGRPANLNLTEPPADHVDRDRDDDADDRRPPKQ